MFESRFNKEGILNPQTGLDYRRTILEPGGSIVISLTFSSNLSLKDMKINHLPHENQTKKDANEMVTNFLGREPNHEAFLKSKGVF